MYSIRDSLIDNIDPLPRVDLTAIETLVFAGGGNRCWWQAGAITCLMKQGWQLPRSLVGTSAGAAVAASCIARNADVALEACLDLYAGNPRNFDWKELRRLRLRFAHQYIYPQWLSAFVNATTFETIRQSPVRLKVGFARPAAVVGVFGSVALGTMAYLVDKYLGKGIHPRLPKLLGLRQEFLALNDCATIDDAQILLNATAAAPPIMASRRIAGSPAIDGGYVDSVPIPLQTPGEKSRTLVLLTRHYPKLPNLFRWRERVYWQPSRRVPVSTWDCTSRTNVREAFALGENDAQLIYLALSNR